MTPRSLLIVLLMAWPAMTIGQTDDAPEPRYRVELIVFAHEPGAAGASEDFLAPADPDFDRELREIDLASAERPDWLAMLPDPAAAAGSPPAIEPIALPDYRQLLDVSQGELRALHQRLQSRAGHRPLLHVIWEQAAQPDAEPPVVDLGAALLASPELNGTARLSRSRFLHLELDLEFLPNDRAAALPMPVTRGGETAIERLVPQYRLQESRRMRSRELHYFDHPAFGVIATVIPASTGGPQEDEAR